MCNRVPQGIIEWLRGYPQIEDNILLGDLLESTIVFQIDTPAGYKIKKGARYSTGIEIELHEERSKMVWMYLLGCLNSNFIGDNKAPQIYDRNSFGVKAFNLTREASDYITVSERRARRTDYEDLK